MARSLTWLSWFTLLYTLAVVLWGDVVQISGSGDGCGAHWPSCHGDALPQFESLETVIEFSHRVTSGALGLLVIAMVWLSYKVFPRGHAVRHGSLMSLIFVITEGLVGAALVLMRLVGTDQSNARIVVDVLHMVNTLTLIAWLALTVYWLRFPQYRPNWKTAGSVGIALWVGCIGIVVVCTFGAITSLGDAVFPVASTAEAIERTQASHVLERIRLIHPFVAVVVSLYTVGLAHGLARLPLKGIKPLAKGISVVFALQLLMGYINVRFAAQMSTQLPHLLLADTLWILWVWFMVTVGAQVQNQFNTTQHTPSRTP